MSFIATIGFFDGVHRGHQYVLRCLADIASMHRIRRKVITFREHPRSVLHDETATEGFLLTTELERKHRLQKYADEVVMLQFADICMLTAQQFLRYLRQTEQVSVLLMGYDHRFGSDMPQSKEDYERMAQEEGVSIVWLSEYAEAGHVSSTVIRTLLRDGDIDKANELLGYEYEISGVVVHGRQIGRQIGFPTANIQVESQKLIPQDGVYAVSVQIEDVEKEQQALLNIGCNPTVGGTGKTLEVHIPNYSGSLYGKHLTLHLKHYLREEMHFTSLSQLRAQIIEDLKKVHVNLNI